MKIKKITFTQGEDGAMPATITVTMTLAEAVWIGKTAGKTTGSASSGIYSALAGDVFNRYWDGGLEEAASEQEPQR